MSDANKKKDGVDPARGRASKTQLVEIARPNEGVAAPLPAGDDLARLPLPSGWEVSLDITEGPMAGKNIQILQSRVTIGRGQVEIALDDQRVSRHHASLEVYGSTCVLLKDLNSTNGTFVNGERITAYELQDSDEIRVGGTVFVVMIGTAPK